MDKKFCDKCKGEITKGVEYYSISVWLENVDSEKQVLKGEYCSKCYKEIKF